MAPKVIFCNRERCKHNVDGECEADEVYIEDAGASGECDSEEA